MSIRAHLLPLGDEAGPAPALYALYGVDLAREVDKRPTGWEEDLDFGGVRRAGLRSPLTMWLIQGASLNIVVDTGCDMSPEARADTRRVLQQHAVWTDHRPEWTVDAQLARFGLRAEDIDVVVNTCCHFDHIGNNTRFPNATFIVQQRELPLAIHPPDWALYYYPEFAFNLLDVRDRLELIDGDLKICEGVSVHLMGGHTPGTQVVLLDTELGRVCLPGDLAPFYKNLELEWPMGAFFDVEGVVRAYRWMRTHADITVPHHDWGFFARHPDGCIGSVAVAAAVTGDGGRSDGTIG
ncbi:MAG: N-acyl homoserine lactonase family protein [Thermoleophilaceae bacterium]